MAVSLELGVSWMDGEHRELVRLFEAFARCIREDAPVEEVFDIVQQAIAAANTHFEHEEAQADATAYPSAADHKFRHRHLRLQLTTLIGDTVGLPSCDAVTQEHLYEMRRLLEEHIDGPDREFAEYLKSLATVPAAA